MKLLKRTHVSQRRLIEILRVIESAGSPVGARAISDCLSSRGYDLGERAVRYNLKILDELGFTKKKGYSGRVLTPLGARELGDALVDDRIGFVNTRIEEYMLRASFDLSSRRGDVIANTSIIDKADEREVFEIMRRVCEAGYTTSRRIMVLEEGESLSSLAVPPGHICIATLCSITLDGLFIKHGIPVLTSFAGLAEVKKGLAAGFTDLIAYAGSSIDPIRVFMGRRVTRVADAAFKGDGAVLANVREVPVAAEASVRDLLAEAASAGLGGLIEMGEPSRPVLGCPVGTGKIGIACYAGVNSVAAAEEAGISIKTSPISAVIDYAKTRELK